MKHAISCMLLLVGHDAAAFALQGHRGARGLRLTRLQPPQGQGQAAKLRAA